MEKNERKYRLIKDRVIRDIRTLFELEEKYYYKLKSVSNFWNNDFIEDESVGDRNRTLSLDKYLSKVELYSRNVLVDLQNYDSWKIRWKIAVNYISLKDAEEELVIHSRSDNIKFTFYNDADEVADEFFVSLCSRYKKNLETSMKGSEFIFDSA